ncbi:MAG: hypothetical protein L3J02_02935 [Henriciella sp.]|nr:hypothetical protein [Henriciella sp.]
MTRSGPTVERVLDLIEAYGADPGAWPDGERDAAQAVIDAQPETFAAALSDARAVDAALTRETVPEPASALAAAILKHAPTAPGAQTSGLGWLRDIIFPQGARWPATAALASLIMGIAGGYAYAATGPLPYDQADAAYYAAFGYDTDMEWVSAEGQE